MSAVLRTPRAAEDLLEIWQFIARDSPRAANRLLRKFDRSCELLSQFSGIGAARDDLSPGLRSIPVGKYLIFYRLIEDGINVIRVLHGARDIDRDYFSGVSR